MVKKHSDKQEKSNKSKQKEEITRDLNPKKDGFSLKKVIQWFTEKSIRWIAVVGLIILIIFLVINNRNAQNTAMDEYQTIKLERGNLVVIVGATGIVEANQTAELAWQTTGRVESVDVKVNDQVKAGEIMADLVDNTLPQSVIFAQADLVAAQKELEDLINSDTESAQAYASLLEAEQDLRDAEDDRDQWNYNSTNIDRVDSARADFIAKEEELKIYKAAYESVKDLPADDPKRVEAKKELNDNKLIRDKALRTLNYLLGKAYGQQVAVDFADYDIAQAKLDDAQREWDRVKNGPNANDISAAEAKVAAAEATVSLGWIEAPFDGTITQVNPKIGDQVSSGTPGFRIDDLSQLFVDVEISEVDINRVQIGQQAELTFDAISGKAYTGVITEVATVGQDSGSGVDFTVTLKISDPDQQVRPGMTAAVNIIVSEKNDILTLPSRAVRLIDGQRVIYTLRNGTIQKVPIETGSTSDTSIEVISGDIKEGDLIVLNPPVDLTSMNGGQPAFTR
jgi:HlyD family secretion protein